MVRRYYARKEAGHNARRQLRKTWNVQSIGRVSHAGLSFLGQSGRLVTYDDMSKSALSGSL